MVAGEIARPVDVLVLGGGPGGYTAAARAAELGREVVLVEPALLGGTCLNVGCIPSKALISLAHDLARARRRIAAGSGLVGDVSVDLAAGQRWKDGVVDTLRSGVTTLLKPVELIEGTGRFVARDRVAIETDHGVVHLRFRHAIVATGSRPATLDELRIDQTRILDSTGALALTAPPEHLAVVGGGYIGVELGAMYATLGSRVTVVEVTDGLLGGFDRDVVRPVQEQLVRLGVDVRTSTAVTGDDGAALHVRGPDGAAATIDASHVLVAVGRRPNTDDLQLEDAGLAPGPGGSLAVDDRMRTATPTIHAVGDVTPGPALAHKAFEQGRVAAEVICGLPAAFDQVVPMVAFTDPELAAVGLGEDAARSAGADVVVGRGRFAANGRALTLDEPAGMVKLVVDRSAEVVVGAQLAGPCVSELVSELTVAVECALRIDDVLGAVHPHPALGEAVVDAALAARRRLRRP